MAAVGIEVVDGEKCAPVHGGIVDSRKHLCQPSPHGPRAGADRQGGPAAPAAEGGSHNETSAVSALKRRKLGVALLIASVLFLAGLVGLHWFAESAYAHFDPELLTKLTATPDTLPEALLLTHTISVARAKQHLFSMVASAVVGGFLGAGAMYVSGKKGTNDLILDLWQRMAAVEAQLEEKPQPLANRSNENDASDSG